MTLKIIIICLMLNMNTTVHLLLYSDILLVKVSLPLCLTLLNVSEQRSFPSLQTDRVRQMDSQSESVIKQSQ